MSALAWLSKPRLESSAGRNFEVSMSSASRSRTAFEYSVRLRRCSFGTLRLGFSFASIVFSSEWMKRLNRRRIRPILARRRHHADAHLLEHLLGDLGVVERVLRIEELELEATC